MPSSKITPDNDSVVTEIEIAAPPERVFKAIVDREQACEWGKNDSFDTVIWELDPRVGGRWRSVVREKVPSGRYKVSEFDHHGEVLEIDPPRLLVYTWLTNFHEPPTARTVVRWELTSIPTGTKLTVTHSGLANLDQPRKDYSQGWPGLVDQIRQYVERQ